MPQSASYTFPVLCEDNGLPSDFQYETEGLGVVDGGLGALLIQLGYLANIWEKTCATRRAEEVVQRVAVTGSGRVDFLSNARADSRRCSGAEIEILRYPSSTDCEFDGPGIIYVGKCGFFRGAAPLAGDGPRPQISVSGGISFGARPAPGLNGSVAPAPANWGDQRSTGMTPTAYGYAAPPVVATSFSFGGSVSYRLNGGTSAVQTENYQFPMRYINFRRSVFNADRPDCTGFWWQLKPGVQANIFVYGNELYHPVSFSAGGEGGGQGEFNPLTCGTMGPFTG